MTSNKAKNETAKAKTKSSSAKTKAERDSAKARSESSSAKIKRESAKPRSKAESVKDKAKGDSPKVSPSGDMLTAHLLAMLNGWSAYGYELAQRLEEAGLGSYNKGSIYRILRHMEDSGLISSQWDTSKDGPARRIYDLTDTGSLFLKNWMSMVEMHQNFINNLIQMNPLIPASMKRGKNRTDEK